MARAGRKVRVMAEAIMGPTPEQANAFVLSEILDRDGATARKLGKAYRRRPMIDMLLDQDIFTIAEHRALQHYRHHADIADRSPIRDSLARGLPSGGGDGPTVAMMNAVRVRDDCERAVGSLREILRAVVVYDQSLSQWAMAQFGSFEDCYQRKGKRVCQLKPRQKALAIAQLDIQIAAQRVQAELDA